MKTGQPRQPWSIKVCKCLVELHQEESNSLSPYEEKQPYPLSPPHPLCYHLVFFSFSKAAQVLMKQKEYRTAGSGSLRSKGISFLTCKGRLRNKLLWGNQVNRGGLGRWTSKSGTLWHLDRLTPRSLCVVPSCGKSFRGHRRSQELPTRLLQLQRWLETEPLCGVNTNSKKLALLWEFYKLMKKNGRKGILVFQFYREPQYFETWVSIHRGIYLVA